MPLQLGHWKTSHACPGCFISNPTELTELPLWLGYVSLQCFRTPGTRLGALRVVLCGRSHKTVRFRTFPHKSQEQTPQETKSKAEFQQSFLSQRYCVECARVVCFYVCVVEGGGGVWRCVGLRCPLLQRPDAGSCRANRMPSTLVGQESPPSSSQTPDAHFTDMRRLPL